MTPPLLNAVPATIHRRRRPAQADTAHQAFADRAAAALRDPNTLPLYVEVTGYGRGWVILAVDYRRQRYTIGRGGGDPIDVAWAAVPLGQ